MVVWITPVDCTPGSAGAWTDVDLSGSIPAHATGVILHFNNLTGSSKSCGFRKNGSTDNRTNSLYGSGSTVPHFWCTIGVDSQIVEIYLGDIVNAECWLVGYFTTDSTFFTNAVDKSTGSVDTWTDMDISSDTGSDTAIGAHFEITTMSTYNMSLRKNGSTDARITNHVYTHAGAMIGVDGSEICEGYRSSTNGKFYLVGYTTGYSTFNTNATNLSLGSTGSWTDLSALPAGATGGYIEVIQSSWIDSYYHGLRKNGSSEDISGTGKTCNGEHGWGFVECDGSRLIEGKIGNTNVDFFLSGYALVGPVTYTKTFTADALLKGFGLTKTFTMDAWVGAVQAEKTFTADALLRATLTKTFEVDALLKAQGLTKTFAVDSLILGGPAIVSPDGGSSETSPVYLVFTTSDLGTGLKRHFLLELDKTSSAFGDLELDLNSYTSQTNWQYWDGGAWQSLPAAGLDPAYYGNNVRYQATLTDGNKWWRVREKMRRDS